MRRFGLGVMWMAVAGPLAAQYPRAERGRFELRGLDFRPRGAWRVRTTAIRTQRRAMLRAGAVRAVNAPATAPRAVGDYALPVLLVQPANVAGVYTPQQYGELLFAPAVAGRPYTLRSYYAELSNGNLQLGGSVFGWWTAPQPNSYYEDGCNGVGVFNDCPHATRLGELLLSALAHVDDGTVDWGRFDNDGPDHLPNSGDDDGIVDFVTFIHPDVDGACGTAHLWSHRWVISAWTGGSPYVTRTARAGRPGEFIGVDDYVLTSGVGGGSSCAADASMPIGTIAHETGHAFGLPDLYDTDPSPSRTEGIGEWGLMSSGAFRSPDSPARMEAWSLVELGWVSVDTLTASRTVTARPITVSDTAFYISVPGRDEYFLLENRQALEGDAALLDPARPGGRLGGLLVWHIDGEKVRSAGLASTNQVNSGPVHGVALVQADGLNQLRAPGLRNRGDSGDPFPGSTGNRQLSWQTTPAAADNAGSFAGFMVDRITQVVPGGAMSFRFTRRERSLVAAAVPNVSVVVNGRSTPRFEDVLVPGDEIVVAAPELVTAPDGRSQYVFSAWSGERPASFTLVPRAEAPETLTAAYTTQYRVRVRITGAGAVESSVAGVVGEGSFVPAGTTVSLGATTLAGAAFRGWTGDTTTPASSLTLVMDHPYDLSAAFTVSSAALAVADAVNALLNEAPLGAELTEALDAAGNRNGKYDVGDLLAYLDRLPAADPALVRRLLHVAGR